MKRIVLRTLLAMVAVVVVAGLFMAWLVFASPRPADTTEPQVLTGDGREVDYCGLPLLDGSGLVADDIPVAYTPGCGYEGFPMPILAACTEPLPPEADDLRGLWQATSGAVDHLERIEQCGNRVVVTSSGVIHDIRSDGTLRHGANDVRPGGQSCRRIFAAGEWVDGVHELSPLGGPVLVRRWREGEELLWQYPGVGLTRMSRLCRHPEWSPAD